MDQHRNRTWDYCTKLEVNGRIKWPNGSYRVRTSHGRRVIKFNDLPTHDVTGIFPIRQSDPVYRHDFNPNHIASHTFDWTLPEHPKAAKTASCANMGPIGVLDDGVMLENALDGQGGDAAAHEVLDVCAGHPDQASIYHHHDIPPCILRTVKNGETKLVGYALDGCGIRSAVTAAPRRVTGCRPRPRRAERPRSEAERRRAPHR